MLTFLELKGHQLISDTNVSQRASIKIFLCLEHEYLIRRLSFKIVPFSSGTMEQSQQKEFEDGDMK